MRTGKLYKLKELYWFLYPSKESAIIAAKIANREYTIVEVAVDYEDAAYYSEYYSKRLNCNVSYISSINMFVLLERDKEFCKVLSSQKNAGWIICRKWTKNDIEEVKIKE